MKATGSPHFHPSIAAALLAVLLPVILAAPARSQEALPPETVLIYRVLFSQTGESVNYPNPSFGRFFVNPETGAMTSVTVLVEPFTQEAYYSTTFLSGTFFKATPFGGGNPYDVIASSNTASGGEQIFLQVTGMASRRLDVGGGERYRLSGRLSGLLLMSGADRPTEVPALTVEAISAELGFVGFSEVTAILQKGATRRANDAGLGLAEATKEYTDELEAIGIEPLEENNPTPNPNPLPTPTPTPLPSPTLIFDGDGGFDFEVSSQ